MNTIRQIKTPLTSMNASNYLYNNQTSHPLCSNHSKSCWPRPLREEGLSASSELTDDIITCPLAHVAKIEKSFENASRWQMKVIVFFR